MSMNLITTARETNLMKATIQILTMGVQDFIGANKSQSRKGGGIDPGTCKNNIASGGAGKNLWWNRV